MTACHTTSLVRYHAWPGSSEMFYSVEVGVILTLKSWPFSDRDKLKRSGIMSAGWSQIDYDTGFRWGEGGPRMTTSTERLIYIQRAEEEKKRVARMKRSSTILATCSLFLIFTGPEGVGC